MTTDRADPLGRGPTPVEHVPEGLSLTVAAVARRLGVAPATLRTWDRRYGLGPSEHTAGSHRRYSARDVARLELMRSLVFQGVAPADAAREARKVDDASEPVPAVGFPAALSFDAEVRSADAALAEPRAEDDPDGAPTAPRRRGGGRIVPLHGGSPQARGLARAALALDSAAVRRIVGASLHERGTIWTWDNLLAPVLIGVGDRFASTGQGVDLEHLLSESMLDAMRDVATTAPANLDRAVLLAAAPEDQHTLPLHAVAAALAERGITSRMLGARLPSAALNAALARSGPAAVMLWSHDAITGDVEVLKAIPPLRPAPVVVVGGPGWPERLPPGVIRVTGLSDAVQRLSNAAQGLG